MHSTDALVIGAGPVGLFQVFQLGLQGLQAHVIDALPHLGGQCVALYGDKPIYDIPALPACTGYELVQRLHAQTTPFAPVFHLGQQVNALQALPEGGLPVTLEIAPEMIHVWHFFHPMLGAARAAIATAGSFMRGHMA